MTKKSHKLSTGLNMSKGVDSSLRKMRTSLNMVDSFLDDMETESSVIRTVSKDRDFLVAEQLRARQVYKLHASIYWKVFMNIAIFLNAVQIGLDAEITGNTADVVWKACDYIFTVIFAVEMIVAIAALRLQYFSNAWYYLDFAVANIAITNSFILPLVESSDSGGLSVFRVFRLLKLLRMARMLKLIPELRQVVQGLFASIKAMFWVFMLLVLFLYTAGIFCKEIIGTSDAGYPSFSEQVKEDKTVLQFNNYLYFGSISRSMTTLFNMVILAEWQEVLRPVAERQPAMILFFVCVVFLCSFGVLNVMIGIVVEHTTNAMRGQQEEQLLKQQKHQIKLASTLADLVFTMDVDNDQQISKEELDNPKNAEQLHAIIGSLGLPHGYSLKELFVMLDEDGSGFLSKLEFVQGIMRLIYCDQFQRDCLFRTAIGHVKHTVARSEECLRQSFKQQLEETCTHLIKQLHQRELSTAFNPNEFTADKADDKVLLERTPESEAGITSVVHVGVVGAKEINCSGQWNDLSSTEILVLEATEVIVLGGQSGINASLDVRDVKLGTTGVTDEGSNLSHRKEVAWHALQKSLVPVKSMGAGSTFDTSAAEEMLYALSSSNHVHGWMPVVTRCTGPRRSCPL